MDLIYIMTTFPKQSYCCRLQYLKFCCRIYFLFFNNCYYNIGTHIYSLLIKNFTYCVGGLGDNLTSCAYTGDRYFNS